MNCPNCNVTLLITTRHEVEIDYCPQCRGVWLDRGELDKIIERSAQVQPKWQQQVDDDDDQHKHDHQANKKHKESFLGEFFDIG